MSPKKLRKMLSGGGSARVVNVFATAQISSGQMFRDGLGDHRSVRMIVKIIEEVAGWRR